MKRLIKKAFGTTLYHGTTLSKLEGIVADGMLRPQESGGGGANPDNPNGFEGFTFVSNDITYALRYAHLVNRIQDLYEDLVVLELDVAEEALMPDDNDCPDCDTAEESLSKHKQAKVLGPITSDYIRMVHFYNQKKDLLLSTSFNGCIDALSEYNKTQRDYRSEF